MNKSMKEKIVQLEAEVAQKTKTLEGMKDDAWNSLDESKADYERLWEAVGHLKTESMSRYQDYLGEKFNHIVGDCCIPGGRG